ncbi:MAG: Ig-like domain repeat protein, partial [Methanobrevibacter ruminantium]|uniref:Ig-like domain repeat protein n=1 Tax=Methanobrevibacter ruminantium TaxID=83816 RepID=UPI0026F1937F
MDKLKKHILFILLISILLCSVQAIAAADISDANGNDVFDLSNDIETVEAGSVDDVIMASEDAVNDNSEILSASNSDEVLSAEPDGNFTQLRNRINGASDTLELDRDYVYDFRYDYYYVGTSGISINKNIVIDGKGHTIDAKGFSRIFQLTGNHVITLKNIVFINGFASDNYGGAIYSARNRNVTLTIDNCTFRNNTAGPNRGTRGGAIYLRAPRELIINNSRFENNSAYYGGAIYGERYIIDNCNFTDNKASFSGSAIYSYTESGNTGTKSISNTRILDNQALATSLSFDYLNPSRDPWTGKIIFDGFIGNFEGGDNLINGIYSDGTYPSFNDVTYLGEDGETTTSSVPTCTNREAGIPIHIIITQNGDIVKDILVTTNSTGGYMVTEEELQLDYGTYSAYAVHYEDTYYTYIKSSSISNFNSYMHITTITNQSVTGYAGDKVNVTFNVTYNTTDWLGRVTVHNVTNGTVIVSIGNQNYTATVRNGQAKVEVVLPEESGDYTALYDGTGTSYWNSTGTLKITILEKEDSTVTVDPEDIHVGDDETIKFNVTDGATGTVKITITGDALDSPIVISDVPISSGAEGVIVPDLAAGTYTVKVEYGGDNHYNPSNGTATFTVSKYDSSVTVDAIDIVYGDNETIKYNVTEDATGTVNITVTDENGEVIASFKNVPIANGTAGVNVAGLSCGTYTVNVTYGGDDQYESSYGTDDFTVGQATPSVTVDASDITYPETENLDIKVTGVSGGAVPSGNVTVTIVDSEGNVVETIADRPINNGVVTVQVTGLAAGEYNVTVVYNGDVNYTEATGKATFKVKKAVPEVIVDASDISYPGDETIEIIVSGVSGGAVPSGNVTVTVTDGSGAVVKTFTEEALADGELSVTVSGLAAGKYNVTVTYNGDENY